MRETKERLAPAATGGRAHTTQLLRNNINRLSPRLQRLIRALQARPRTVRELSDIIPTNNPAEYVRQLRESFGLTIFCEHVKFTTVDGEASWYGRYHLTASDLKRVREIRWPL